MALKIRDMQYIDWNGVYNEYIKNSENTKRKKI